MRYYHTYQYSTIKMRLLYEPGKKIGPGGNAGAKRVRFLRILGTRLHRKGFGYNKTENSTKNRRKKRMRRFLRAMHKKRGN
jgi:hypothetical protein